MIRKSNQYYQVGFTLVELMLAMAFVAMLLLAIAGVVLQIAGTYNKGVTMQAVNQAGRAIVTDMRRTIASGPQFDVHAGVDPETHLFAQTNFVLQWHGNDQSQPIDGGRLCTGTYTYVWNVGRQVVLNANGTVSYQVNKYIGDSAQIRFVKVIDNGGVYCKLPAGSNDYPPIRKNDATELFADPNLTVQCFQVNKMQCQSNTTTTTAPLTTGASAQLYNMTILISSASQDALTTVGDCKTPDVVGAYENYCAVNEFNFTAEAGNGGGQ